MTISQPLIAAVSAGQIVVNDSGPFTTAIYDLIVPDAKSLLDQEEVKGILPSNIYDRCHALLVCHLWTIGNPTFGLSSYHSGDFSQSIKDPGQSVYWMQFQYIIQKWNQQNTPQAEDSVARADCDMGLGKLDPNSIITPWTGPGNSTATTNPWGLQQ